MAKSKKSIEEIEKDMEPSLDKYTKYRELKEAIMVEAEKWKKGELNDRMFQESIYDSIDDFIKTGKWTKPKLWK